MSQYDPVHLKQLLQLCCWNSKVETTKSGFDKICGDLKRRNGKDHKNSVEYLQNLWTQVKTKIESQELLSKDDEHISELLSLCDYTTWEEFEQELARIESFIDEYPDISDFDEANAVIITTEKEMDELRPFIPFHRKLIDFNVRMVLSQGEKMNNLRNSLEENTFVLSYFPTSANECDIHPIDTSAFENLTDSNRYVPVWSGNHQSDYQIKGIKKHQRIIGLRGLKLALLVLDIAKDKKSNSEQNSNRSKKSGYTNTIQNFKGIISQGDLNIESGGLNIGDTYNNSEKKK